jgi:hypothetical protein
MVQEDQDGHVRTWYSTCGAEVKAWVASVIWWCLSKNQAFEQFHQNNVDPNLTKKWFSSWKQWTAIKHFLKISDPNKDKENKQNFMDPIQSFQGTCSARG